MLSKMSPLIVKFYARYYFRNGHDRYKFHPQSNSTIRQYEVTECGDSLREDTDCVLGNLIYQEPRANDITYGHFNHHFGHYSPELQHRSNSTMRANKCSLAS